ncbi:MAG: hypothetical protein LAP38_13370 [Acidobacteriia bacterium]|nr:hypothetical protein [Terriglobia bacterium]
MGELVDRDDEHLRLLKLGYYNVAGITGFFSLFPIIFVVVGSLISSGSIPLARASGSSDDPRVMGVVMLSIGIAALAFGLAGAFLTFLTGRHCAQPPEHQSSIRGATATSANPELATIELNPRLA